jgi:hypothetical protein
MCNNKNKDFFSFILKLKNEKDFYNFYIEQSKKISNSNNNNYDNSIINNYNKDIIKKSQY